MTGRRIGVGFNQPWVLDGGMRSDWRAHWAFAKRLTRMVHGGGRGSRRRNTVFAASTVETHRLLMMEQERRWR